MIPIRTDVHGDTIHSIALLENEFEHRSSKDGFFDSSAVFAQKRVIFLPRTVLLS
jgi:hypothetical protein